MAYLYRHIRLDKNEVFYVGIGSDDKGKYERAYDSINRNKHWKNIIKNTLYETEIIIDDLTWEQVCEKEKEFIQLYGRRDLKKGTLTNLTDGGEGTLRMIRPTGKFVHNSIEVLQYDIEGNFIKEWDNMTSAATILGIDVGSISKCCQGYKKSYKSLKGFIWRYKELDKWFPPIYSNKVNSPELYKHRQKPVEQFTINGEFIKEFESIRECIRQTDFTRSSISMCCHGKYEIAYGFKWKFKNNNNL